jgi:fumarylacetoacetase
LANHQDVFAQPTLNAFAQLGRAAHRQVRSGLRDLLSADTRRPEALRDNAELREKALLPQRSVKMHLPMAIGDYTDFYAGYYHAFAVGTMFRGAQNALQPNYTHLPVGYHGRASSIVVSGSPVRRPVGQILLDPVAEPRQPTTGPSRKLDFELELGCFIAKSNEMGERVSVAEAEEYIFGYVLLNDWSARDIQSWEYVPLGPFNSKNFGTTISPWVVLADALEPFRTEAIENATELQAYLEEGSKATVFGMRLEVDLTSESRLLRRGRLCNLGLKLMLTRRSSRGRHHNHHQDKWQEPDVVV